MHFVPGYKNKREEYQEKNDENGRDKYGKKICKRFWYPFDDNKRV